MTTPATAQQQQPPPQQAGMDIAIATAIAEVLITALTVDLAYQALLIKFRMLHFRFGNDELAGYRGALQAVMDHPHDRIEGVGSAQTVIARLNLMRRAQFVVHAARRIAIELAQARAEGRPLGTALRDAVAREKRYYGQHLDAINQRMEAASRVDARAAEYGPLLGWYTVRDRRTSAECLAANGKNFYSYSMPLIGYPGGVHPHCRCYPGRPYAGAAILPSARMAA